MAFFPWFAWFSRRLLFPPDTLSFFSRSFDTSCWNKLGILWLNSPNICDRILNARQSHALPFFMEIFLIASLEIWNLRNSKIFDNARLMLALLKYPFYPLFNFDNGMNLISKSLTILTSGQLLVVFTFI